MSKQLLYLFGEPGTGKITVARILQQRLGWRLFWLHDLDSVCAIVGRYPLPRLMDEVSASVLNAMMEEGQSVIYVRPSRDRESVESAVYLANHMGYKSHLLRLTACRQTQIDRVSRRERSKFRISSEAELDSYLNARPDTSGKVEGVHSISTDGMPPEWIADKVQAYLSHKEIRDHERDRVERAYSPFERD